MSVLFVTGTSTGVGKTVATAALAACALATNRPVTIVKLVQTGLPEGAPGDVAEAGRLSGCRSLVELHRYPDPLAPEAAARASGRPFPDLARLRVAIEELAATGDLVLVEGAGGLLVRFDARGQTLADLAAMMAAPVVVVAAAGLGTLNHTALTLEALDRRRIAVAGVILGSWTAEPDLAARSNLADFPAIIGEPLQGALPEGAAGASREGFRTIAVAGLSPRFGGQFDVRDLDPPPLTAPTTDAEDAR